MSEKRRLKDYLGRSWRRELRSFIPAIDFIVNGRRMALGEYTQRGRARVKRVLVCVLRSALASPSRASKTDHDLTTQSNVDQSW
jgi:hypothetical protein